MKPDKFDEAIRRKLEGIQPNFQEEDWGKFKAYQTTHMPTSFVQRYGRSMMYTAASVAAAVMVFANVYQYRQKQHLAQEITRLKGEISQKDNAPIRTSTRIDTVYITKYISLEPSSQPNAYAQSVPSSNEINTHELKTETPDQVSESLKNVGKIIRQNPNERISKVFERQPVEAEKSISEEHDNSNTIAFSNDKSSVGSSSVKVKNNSGVPKKEMVEKSSDATTVSSMTNQKSTGNNKNDVSKNEQIAQTNEASEATNGSVINNVNALSAAASLEVVLLEPKQTLSDLEGIEPAEIRVQRYAYANIAAAASSTNNNATTETKTSPPPSIPLKGLKFRIGTGLNIGDKFTGYSFNTSLLLGKYWSIDVAIGKAKINGPQYYTDAIFKAKNNSDFQTWKKSGVPSPPLLPPQAFDITTSVSLVRMPISLTYRWPINEGLTVLSSVGTNLNLSAHQGYSYFYKERNWELKQETGVFNAKPALSNDFMFSAGIEKQWKRLVVQGEAYAAPYLQKPSYLTENRNIGVRLKILYEFGKKRI